MKSFKETYRATLENYCKNEMKLMDFLKPNLITHYTIIDKESPFIVDDMVLKIHNEELLETDYFAGIFKIVDVTEMNIVGENILVSL